MLDLMKAYNVLVERFKKAILFYEDMSVPFEVKEQQNQRLNELMSAMDRLNNEIVKRGYETTQEERLEGFRQVKFLGL